MTAFIGIDPGLKGGVALLDLGALTPAVGFVMPVEGHWIQCSLILAQLRSMSLLENVHAVVELVGAMPKQGLSSTFKFGTGYGQIIGMLQAVGIPYTLVRPQAWKGVVLAGTSKDKDAAIAFCRREYPGVQLVPPRCRVPHDGIADALCLAHYGSRMAGTFNR